jgi:hypothetical protein
MRSYLVTSLQASRASPIPRRYSGASRSGDVVGLLSGGVSQESKAQTLLIIPRSLSLPRWAQLVLKRIPLLLTLRGSHHITLLQPPLSSAATPTWCSGVPSLPLPCCRNISDQPSPEQRNKLSPNSLYTLETQRPHPRASPIQERSWCVNLPWQQDSPVRLGDSKWQNRVKHTQKALSSTNELSTSCWAIVNYCLGPKVEKFFFPQEKSGFGV